MKTDTMGRRKTNQDWDKDLVHPYSICANVHRAALGAIQCDGPYNSPGIAIREFRWYDEWEGVDEYHAHTSWFQAYQDEIYRISWALIARGQVSEHDVQIMQDTGMLYGRFYFFLRPPSKQNFVIL